jgi:hypothetical protein
LSERLHDEFQNPGNKILGLVELSVFWTKSRSISDMQHFSAGFASRRLWRLCAIGLITGLSGGALILCADTPTELRAPSVGTCYCHCTESQAQHSCVKICDAQRYARRQSTSRCAKPRLRLPVENRDAGPRFPHPGRAERADASTSNSFENVN